MAPISFTTLYPQPQPHVEVRQGPSPYVVTLTITRETTTYTSTITLGTDTGGATAAATTTNTLATTTAAPAPVQTLAAAPAQTTTDNNGAVIGGVIGSILGFAVLATLVWKCCFDPRSVIWRPTGYYEGDSSYWFGSEGSSRSRSSRARVRRRGGDGDYVKKVQRSYGLRRPSRAYMRPERRRSYDAESDGTWRDEKRRRSRKVVRNGVPGWNLWGGGRRSKRSYGRRDYVEREEVRVRYSENIDD